MAIDANSDAGSAASEGSGPVTRQVAAQTTFLILTPEPTEYREMPPKQTLKDLFIPERILTRGVTPQTQSPLLNNTAEVVNLILGEIKKNDFHTIDRIMFSLTCKSAARLLQIPKTQIPRPLRSGNDTISAKRQRFNFTIRLAPWFDDLSAGRDKALTKRELNGNIRPSEIVIINHGFEFCISCLQYRRRTVFMKQIESRTFPKTFRWTRCLPGITSSTSAATVVLSTDILDKLDEIDNSEWSSIEVDKKKMPLFKPPPKIQATTTAIPATNADANANANANKRVKLSHNTGSLLGGGDGDVDGSDDNSSSFSGLIPKNKNKGKGKGKGNSKPHFPAKKRKISPPRNEAEADARAAAEAAKLKALRDAQLEAEKTKSLTGLEDCEYLPVDASGELRIAVMGICGAHAIDPLKLVGI